MDVEAGEFHDWEVLHNSGNDAALVNSPPNSVETMGSLEGIEADSEGLIHTNYFSIDSQNKCAKTPTVDCEVSEGGSVESDYPSWIDPETTETTLYLRKESGGFWSDSSSDRSDDHKFKEFDVENEKTQLGVEGIGEIGTKIENSLKFWADSGGIGSIVSESEISDQKNELCVGENENSQDGLELSGKKDEEEDKSSIEGGENEKVAIAAVNLGGEEEKRSLVLWWKLPLEFLKYCALRVRPVWSLSVAVAVVGFVILGRRLYKMKRKSRSLELKVTVDDKKVSQFMSRPARLNEAFSVVKRVPMVRPLLPAVGVTPWPVMSLR